MDPAKEIFLDALEEPAGTREAFVASACAGDEELQRDVLELLSMHARMKTGRATTSVGSDPLQPLIARRSFQLGEGAEVGPYRIRRLLGEGGFGLVYLAEQARPMPREVALKVLKPGMDSVAVLNRFEMERQALARMNHPSICRILDAGMTAGGLPWFAMEAIDGVSLTRYCNEHELGLDERLGLFAEVCDAVQHAHQKGVIHRDLKPSNVLVADTDGRAMVKVIDFGVSKAVGRPLLESVSLTVEGLLLGTPAYMSPEQAEGSPDIDTRTDVYGLGAMLYELLAGMPPFDGEGVMLEAVLHRIRAEDPPRPSRRLATRAESTPSGPEALGDPAPSRGVSWVPKDLDWIVMRCLAKEPGRRYATAAALRADLARFQRSEPVEAAPPSRWYHVRKLVMRHRLAVAASAALLVSLIAGVVGTTRGMIAAGREAEAARVARALAATEAEEAARQERIAQAVVDFLTEDLLAAVSPSAAPGEGRDVTMRTVLDEAARRLDDASAPGGRFADEPAVVSELRHTLGMVYFELGEYASAREHLEQARLLREGEGGFSSLKSLEAACNLAVALRHTGDYAACEALLKRLRAEPNLESIPEAHVSVLTGLAHLHQRLGRHEEAIAAFEESIAACTAYGGPDGDATLRARSGLAISLLITGQSERAADELARCYDIRVRTRGTDDPTSLGAGVNLVAAYLELGRFDEAEELLLPVLAGMRRVLGDDHPSTAQALANLGRLRLELGEDDASIEAYTEALEVFQREFGVAHSRTINMHSSLNMALAKLGRHDQAESHARALVELAEEHLEPADRSRLAARADLIEILSARGDAGVEVASLAEANYDELAGSQGERDPDALIALVELAVVLAKIDPERATQSFERALEVSRAIHGREHPKTLRIESDLALVLWESGETAAALDRFEYAYTSGARVLPPDDLGFLVIAMRYSSALRESGRLDAAEPLLLQTYDSLLEHFPAGDTSVSDMASELAALYAARGDDEAAGRWSAAAELRGGN